MDKNLVNYKNLQPEVKEIIDVLKISHNDKEKIYALIMFVRGGVQRAMRQTTKMIYEEWLND